MDFFKIIEESININTNNDFVITVIDADFKSNVDIDVMPNIVTENVIGTNMHTINIVNDILSSEENKRILSERLKEVPSSINESMIIELKSNLEENISNIVKDIKNNLQNLHTIKESEHDYDIDNELVDIVKYPTNIYYNSNNQVDVKILNLIKEL